MFGSTGSGDLDELKSEGAHGVFYKLTPVPSCFLPAESDGKCSDFVGDIMLEYA